MLKRVVVALIVFINISGLFTVKADYESQFTIDYDITYQILESGEALV